MLPDKDQPLVTIVTPTYNQARYLAQTIESVLAQDYPRLEYIVLDDGSTDGTAEILSRYKGRIKYETHQNMGQSRTLNKGWQMAQGSILGYLSSDDLLHPAAVSCSVRILLDNPENVVSYCDFEIVDALGAHVKNIRTADFDERLLTERLICIPGPGAFFKREIFDATGGWNPDLAQTPDFDFWLKACHKGGFVRIPQSLAKYRMHQESASFRPISERRANEIIEVVETFWRERGGAASSLPFAMARLISARMHINSGRIRMGFGMFREAITLRPSMLASISAWRFLAAGLLKSFIYKRTASVS